MKKLFALLIVVAFAASLAACKKTTEPATTTAAGTPDPVSISLTGKADGYYFAADDNFTNSYRYYVILKVQGGKIVEATWDGYHIDGYESGCQGESKFECSTSGKYGMVAKGGAKAEWHVQAKAAADFSLNKTTIELDYSSPEGDTDDISGVSIHVVEYFNLVKKALSANPVAAGDYVDGYHTVKGTVDTSKGDNRYSFATFVVVNGRIVLVDINGAQPITDLADATKSYKTKDAAKENYNMSQVDGMEWFQQAQKIETYLLTNQGLDDLVWNTTTNKTDEISGVTIKVNGYVALWDLFTASYTKA